MAAVVKSELCNFFILAPNEYPECTHAIVPYKMLKACITSEICKAPVAEKRLLRHPSEGNFVSVPLNAKTSDTRHNQNDSDLVLPNKADFVKTHPSFLQTLSQTHSGWIFGAIAELVDNARDANATRLDIKVESRYARKAGCEVPVLSVVDDGCGMSHVDIVRMLSFGHKKPEQEDFDRIGRFGIGFKTGAMRLGKDALVLTQTSTSRSVALLSQSYNEKNENVEIPIITYCKKGEYMEVDPTIQSEETAALYEKAIEDVSPFNKYLIASKLGLFGEKGTGTQIFIWNLDKWGSDYTLLWGSSGLFPSFLFGSYLLKPPYENICAR